MNNYNSSILNSITSKTYCVGVRSIFDKLGWINLWQNKLDYYEYQQSHINYYSYISESFNYYLGMGETAIAYIRYNVDYNEIPIFLSHKRISNTDFNNPFNLTFDYKARDVSGYLKYLFLHDEYHEFDMESFFGLLNFSRLDYILLYGRLLFPSFYFDVYDEVINDGMDQKKIKSIITRSEEYEAFLKTIFAKINSLIPIPSVEWLY